MRRIGDKKIEQSRRENQTSGEHVLATMQMRSEGWGCQNIWLVQKIRYLGRTRVFVRMRGLASGSRLLAAVIKVPII